MIFLTFFHTNLAASWSLEFSCYWLIYFIVSIIKFIIFTRVIGFSNLSKTLVYILLDINLMSFLILCVSKSDVRSWRFWSPFVSYVTAITVDRISWLLYQRCRVEIEFVKFTIPTNLFAVSALIFCYQGISIGCLEKDLLAVRCIPKHLFLILTAVSGWVSLIVSKLLWYFTTNERSLAG